MAVLFQLGFNFLCHKLCILTTGWQHLNSSLLVWPWECVEVGVMSVKVRWVTTTHPHSTTFTHNALLSSSSTVSNNNPLFSNRIRQTDDSTWITDKMEWVLTIQPPTSPSAHLNISMCTLCGGQVAACPKSVQKYCQNIDQSSSNIPVYPSNV